MTTLSPSLAAVAAALNPQPISRHDALLRDLQDFAEDVANLACDQGWHSLEHRADSLHQRLKRELEA
jgi:hypothetical protein